MRSLFLLLKEVNQFKHQEAVLLLFRLQYILLIKNFIFVYKILVQHFMELSKNCNESHLVERYVGLQWFLIE